MADYFASGEQTLTSTADSALAVYSGTAGNRTKVYEINFGNVGTPADLTSIYLFGQITSSGAGTSVTSSKVDPADGTGASLALSNLTTEPTYTNTIVALNTPAAGDLLRVPLNHRGTYRWVAPPGGELVAPATSLNGIAGKSDHASAVTDYMVGFHWRE